MKNVRTVNQVPNSLTPLMQIISNANRSVSLRQQGSGSPVVLLHGIQGTAGTWDAVAPLLATHYKVIAPNLRGRSGSTTPDNFDGYALREFARDLQAVLDWVDQPVVLAAWSMGVSVTLELLGMNARQNLRGLVLISGSACVGNEARWFTGRTTLEIADEARERGKRLSLVDAAGPLAVAASWQHVQQADFKALLPQIHLPTLVVHGADDDQCPISHGRLIAQSIPGARLDEWADTGHNPMTRDVVRFTDTVRNFIDSLQQ